MKMIIETVIAADFDCFGVINLKTNQHERTENTHF